MNHTTYHLELEAIYLNAHQSFGSNLLMPPKWSHGDCKLINCNMLRIHT